MCPKVIARASNLITYAIFVSNNGIFPRVGPRSDATRWSSHECSKRADLLTLLQIRDNVAARTLTSAGYTNATGMTVENCVNYCNTRNFIYAGVEYGQECCELCFQCHPIHTLVLSRLRYSDHMVCEYKIVGMSYQMGGRPLRIRIVASHAAVTQVSIVVPALALTCIGVVLPPRLALSSRLTMDFGFPWDAIGTSNFLF